MSETLSSQLSIFRGSTVLITGAAGFIGKHLVSALNKLGANIILVDRKTSGNIHGVDVSIANQVDRIFKTTSLTRGKSIDYVLSTTKENLNTWVTVKANVKEGFKKLHGLDVTHLSGIAIMADTDNSKLKAISYYQNIYFSSE